MVVHESSNHNLHEITSFMNQFMVHEVPSNVTSVNSGGISIPPESTSALCTCGLATSCNQEGFKHPRAFAGISLDPDSHKQRILWGSSLLLFPSSYCEQLLSMRCGY